MFFFEQKTAYVMRISDWSSDVCSSDLGVKWSATARFEALTPLVEIIYRHWNCLIADSLFLYAPAAEGECMNSLLYTIGYEGSDLANFLLTLQQCGIKSVIVVREVPLSRKRGFSKTASRKSGALGKSGSVGDV